MQLFTLLTVISFLLATQLQAKNYQITSPNGRLVLNISADKQLTYSLKAGDTNILKNSSASLSIRSASNINKASTKTFNKVINTKRNSVNRILTPHVKQKSKEVLEHYNELILQFDNHQSIAFRLFDQGMAYRFATQLTGVVDVMTEQANINFSHDNKVLFPQEKSFISHNERLYLSKTLMGIKADEFASLPLLVDVKNYKVVITETGLRDYPGMWLKGNADTSLQAVFPKQVLKSELKKDSDRNENIITRAAYLAKNQLSQGRNYPWRVFAISKNDSELLTNQLSYLLADELKINDPSWIKPGKVAWDWWNANNIYGVDFEAGLNTQTYKYYIDFAAKYGLEYIVLDEGWHNLGSVLDVVPAIDVEEIINYGKKKNVDVILWVIWKTLDEQLELALSTFEKWGAAGIKVDFMQRDDQEMVNYYWRVAEQAAKHHLLVDYHGAYKPAGLRRAYPNVITREGVRGLEHNKWGDYITAEHNLTIPFIRQLAGPMDYTPGAMHNAQPENFKIIFNRPMSKTTRVHQMAMYVVFESPLQMLADSPSSYLREHQSTSFISKVPTVWDETRVLSAKIADHIIIARRSGKEWFIGVMGNSKKREFTIDLSFLDKGDYKMESFADGHNADKYASDYQVNHQQVTNQRKVTIKLAPSGGWVAHLTR
jgi:alpha-glucosidase